MPTAPKVPRGGVGGIRFSIPPALLKMFSGQPRLILKPFPGLLILDARTLFENPELTQQLLGDEKFRAGYDIVAVPKGIGGPG